MKPMSLQAVLCGCYSAKWGTSATKHEFVTSWANEVQRIGIEGDRR